MISGTQELEVLDACLCSSILIIQSGQGLLLFFLESQAESIYHSPKGTPTKSLSIQQSMCYWMNFRDQVQICRGTETCRHWKRSNSREMEVGDVIYSLCKAKGKLNLLGHSQWYIHRTSWLFLMMFLLTASIPPTSAFRNLSHHRQGCTGVGRSGHRVMLYLKNVGSFLPSFWPQSSESTCNG